MLKVNDKINSSSEADMAKLKEASLNGKWIVTNRKRTIVKFIGTEQGAREFYNTQRLKRGGSFLVGALRTVKITAADQQRYNKIQSAIADTW